MDNSANEEKPRIIGSYDQESIIDRFLDIINIKKLLKIVFDKTPFKVTNSFISGLILLIFLIWSSYADNFSRNIVILILIVFLVLDLLGKNVDFIRKYLFSEDSNNAFLDNINKYSFIEAERQTKLRKFTSKNINHYLKRIHENPNPKYGFVLENILLYNNLSIENFDILFSEDFLNFDLFRKDFIINLLINYKDKLSKKDLLNLYNYFKTDEMILRYIFATQIQSEFLIKEKNELKQYSEKFQIKNLEFRKLKLSVPSFPLDLIKMRLNVAKFGTILAIVLYLGIVFTVNFFINLITPNDYVNQSNSAIITWILICALIASVLISYIVLKIFHPRLMKRWNKFKEFVESE